MNKTSHAVATKRKKETAYPDQVWAELIGRMSDGDQSALAELYDQSSRLVFGMVMRVVNDRSAAEEITLDTFHQVWRQARNFDSERGRPSSWVITIARNRAIDRLRAARWDRQEQTPLEDVTPFLAAEGTPEQSTYLNEQQKLVRTALANLKTDQRQLIEIAFFAGLTHQEISDKLNLPLGTIKTRIRAGMIKLRELLAEA
ncbi:MAG: sigma-70 family RNA polymerase sigma factor [Acidobacteriota bacterium]|nr:sigma-70 family RNA polymerase sigma factor [Acidobacteriota bacterium]